MVASQEDLNTVMSLQGEDALTVVNILDKVSRLIRTRAIHPIIPVKVFETSNMSPDLRRRIVHILQRVCYSQTILPRSCILSDILKEGDIAFTSGSFARAWKGRYNGNPVRVKAFCADTPENLPRAKQVRSWTVKCSANFRPTRFGSACSRKLSCGGVSPTQTSCQCWVSPQSRSPCA